MGGRGGAAGDREPSSLNAPTRAGADATISDVGGLGDVRCFALTPSHPLSVLRGDDGHHERRRGDCFERREVDFLLQPLIYGGGLRSEPSGRCA